ncbi:MAG TPA: S1/P1 nuclease [Rhodocyclaceae bacterium]|nr:S1/P1 nuclease [Rhodocyclaceae bacterium]
MRDSFGWAGLGWFFLLLASNATAWNAAGHRLSASLAWNEMSAETQRQVTALLQQHPALPLWEQQIRRGKAAVEVTPLALFAEASTWPDELRRQAAAVKDSDKQGAAVNRDWHYVNWPVGRGAAHSRGGRLDQAIEAQAARLADRWLPAGDRAVALAWLVHLVADAHQPLHVATWPLPDGSFDDGGLGFPVRDDQRRRFADTSLHSWWDELPGPPWLRGERLASRSELLREAYPAAAIAQRESGDWIAESFELAGQDLRPSVAADQLPWPISEAYRARAKKISERRLAESGVRLGRLLDAILSAERAIRRARDAGNAGRGATANRPETRAPAGACCPASAVR